MVEDHNYGFASSLSRKNLIVHCFTSKEGQPHRIGFVPRYARESICVKTGKLNHEVQLKWQFLSSWRTERGLFTLFWIFNFAFNFNDSRDIPKILSFFF